MIKGIVALFTSGILFKPMVLLGIISGFVFMFGFDEQARQMLTEVPFLYVAVAVVAVLYTFSWDKVYKEGGEEVDWVSTTGLAVWNFALYFIALFLTISFVVLISF
jgi:hypothetical protein